MDQFAKTVTSGIVSFTSAQAITDLSKNFVTTIIQPLVNYILSLLKIDNIKDITLGNLLIGEFIEALIQCFIVLGIIYIFYKYVEK